MSKELDEEYDAFSTQESDGIDADSRNDTQVCTLKIKGMMCSACSGTIERGLNATKGVHTASVQLLLETAHVSFDSSVVSAEQIAEEVEDLGFDCSVLETMAESASKEDLVVLNIFGAFVPARDIGFGVRSSCRSGDRQYSLRYNAKLIGARKIMAKVREVDALAEVETRQVKTVEGIDPLLKDFLMALPSALVVFYLCLLAPTSVKQALSFFVLPGLHFLTMLLICLVTPVQFVSGKRFHVGAYRAIANRSPNMEVLISVATNLAYLFSMGTAVFSVAISWFIGETHDQPPPHFFEAPTTLICVMLLGKYIEGRAKMQTARSLDRLMDLTPEVARLKESNEDIPVALVELGDELVIFPGERVPCDGKIVHGDIEVDESLLTGESTAVVKGVNARVIGGSICLKGNATIVVDCIGENTTVNQIMSLIEHAQETRAPVQLVADKIGRIFVPGVLVVAAATMVVWGCLVGAGCVHGHHHTQGHLFGNAADCLFALKFGLSVLLVACPCALGLATPTAVMVASSVAADHGILIKSIIPLENTRKIKVAVMDKTGTLTRGCPTVSACVLLAPNNASEEAVWNALPRQPEVVTVKDAITRVLPTTFPMALDVDVARGDFWALVACAESKSEHPLAKAIVRACPWKGPEPLHFANGLRGIDATVTPEVTVRIGSATFVREKVERADAFSPLLQWSESLQDAGCTIVYVSANGILLGALAVEDSLAPGAVQTVRSLQNRGVKVVMCTGDAASTAHAVAQWLNIDDSMVYSEVLPQDKVRTVAMMQERFGRTLMIGDGLNDAAALGKADVGVAIGCGSQVSLRAADVVLARSEITDLLSLFSLADATIHTVYRNFAFSLVFNMVLVPIAAGILYPIGISLNPMLAGLCMAASSISVISSSLLLRRWVPVQRTLAPAKIGVRRRSQWSLLSGDALCALDGDV